MNKREKYVWDQMQTFLKTSYKDPEAQQYIHSAQVRHTHWMSNIKGASPSQLKTIRNTILPRVALYAVLKEYNGTVD